VEQLARLLRVVHGHVGQDAKPGLERYLKYAQRDPPASCRSVGSTAIEVDPAVVQELTLL
jgi:hypothetical protein